MSKGHHFQDDPITASRLMNFEDQQGQMGGQQLQDQTSRQEEQKSLQFTSFRLNIDEPISCDEKSISVSLNDSKYHENGMASLASSGVKKKQQTLEDQFLQDSNFKPGELPIILRNHSKSQKDIFLKSGQFPSTTEELGKHDSQKEFKGIFSSMKLVYLVRKFARTLILTLESNRYKKMDTHRFNIIADKAFDFQEYLSQQFTPQGLRASQMRESKIHLFLTARSSFQIIKGTAALNYFEEITFLETNPLSLI